MSILLFKLSYIFKPKQLLIKIKLKIRLFLLKRYVELSDNIQIKSTESTINEIEKCIVQHRKGVYLRFGDGDINLLHGVDELLQSSVKGIKDEMRESFSLSGDGVFKCLPIHSDLYGAEEGMKEGLHKSNNKLARNFILQTFEYFIGDNIYSHVALSYLIFFKEDVALRFLRCLKNFNPIFVGNEEISKNLLKTLFGNTIHIKTPKAGSFSKIDSIELELSAILEKNKDKYTVIVIAMGCSGRILEKRIYKKFDNIFLFDFGSSMDYFSGWNTRSWMDLLDLQEGYLENFLKKL